MNGYVEALVVEEPTPCFGRVSLYELADLGDPHAVAEAKALCASCPVAAECLALALTDEVGRRPCDRFSVAGGLTARERYHLERKQRKEAVA